MSVDKIKIFPDPTKLFYEISDYDISLLLILLIFIFLYFFRENIIVKRILNKIYSIFLNISNSQLGTPDFAKFFTFLFLFVFLGNIIGVLGFFGINTYYMNTIILSILVFSLSLVLLFTEHSWYFYQQFIPNSSPLIIKPLIGILEIFSFIIKPITLFARLLFNISIGHLLIHILSTIDIPIFNIVLPLIISLVECGTSFLQAYLFTIFSATMIKIVYVKNH